MCLLLYILALASQAVVASCMPCVVSFCVSVGRVFKTLAAHLLEWFGPLFLTVYVYFRFMHHCCVLPPAVGL